VRGGSHDRHEVETVHLLLVGEEEAHPQWSWGIFLPQQQILRSWVKETLLREGKGRGDSVAFSNHARGQKEIDITIRLRRNRPPASKTNTLLEDLEKREEQSLGGGEEEGAGASKL